MEINPDNIKKVHVIGIKGSGVIAAVEILHSMGMEITGSDTAEKFFTDAILERLGIKYFEKFDALNIPVDTDLVIYSTAYNIDNNVEFEEAVRRKLPMASYPEILEQLFNEKYGIAVCGTHGKTTTSAWLANTLKAVGADPMALIGSKVKNWDGNALSGKSEYFIAEADEFQNKLRLYNPKAVVLTSLDFDHPDYFKDFGEYKKVFSDFLERIPQNGFLVVWGDSTDTLEVSRSAKCETLAYGISSDCDYVISKTGQKKFSLSFRAKWLGEFEIQLVGDHNILNAAAVIAVCHKLSLNMDKVRQSIKNFQGTARRFEYKGLYNGAIIIDDYAHHPEEIKATLKAAREVYPEKNIWAIFHPHTYTRTKALMAEFSQSFSDADKAIVLDIYGSARETQGGVHSQELVDLINKFDRGKAEYIPTISETVKHLKDKIGSEDVVLTIGAGNVWEVAEKLSAQGESLPAGRHGA